VDWSRVTELFDRARLVPAAERAAWLRAACDDESVRAEVEALLQAYDEEPGFLEAPADARAALQALDRRLLPAAEGRRIGAYRLVREIGRGGMGVVYEAARDDAEFERRVAIKVLPAAWATSALAERFRFERRVLAGLDHPNIARLLDAGTVDDVPYFVMEYVDGQPIDAWCRANALTVRQRVELLLAVCDAVEHAHRHLVVHRDLKPANILIATDGRPRLLDFGIATMVSEEGGASPGLTRTGQVSFTPEYASPEQVRGGSVSTSTDVYSLGVLAYRLLSGRAPYELSGLPPLEAMRISCEVDPPAPSRVAPAPEASLLRGDLDTIVLKALRKDPADRYPTVFGLSADLAAWMEGRPVSATPATLAYRARKFVARNRVAVAAATVVALALLGGGAATAWQARVARVERDKAQNRFNQVRQFSRSLLFDVHESLRTLPGATEPRRLLLDRAVQFLDGLAADAGDDTALKLELAEGYRRLGQVQGSDVSDNVGDRAGAAASFEKAVRLGTDALAAHPDSLGAINVATGALDDLAQLLRHLRRGDEADRANQQHLALIEALERHLPDDPAARASVASSYLNIGMYEGARGRAEVARERYARSIAVFDALPAEQRARDEVISGHSFALKRLGALEVAAGQLDDGERHYRAALALDEELVARHPDHPRYRFDMTFSLTDLGLVARRRGDLATAEALYRRALEVRQAELDADPKNVRVMKGVASAHRYLLRVLLNGGRPADAVGHARATLQLQERLLGVVGPSLEEQFNPCWGRVNLAWALLAVAADAAPAARAPDVAEASSLLRRAGAPGCGGERGLLANPDFVKFLDEQRARLRALAQ
jgi:non-specific serine/threonine protein kinase/serine/threonine-protein kinase